jgi:branched-chain amino acid transport system ATP-binding protein
MSQALLSTEYLDVRYGSYLAVSGVRLAIRPNSIHSIIGPNGAGKTTLFHALTGRVRASAGRIVFGGEDITKLSDDRRVRIGLARSFQVTTLFRRLSVRENLRLAAQGRTPWPALKMWESAERNRDAMATVDALLDRLDLMRVAGQSAEELSHGQQRRLEVGMAMASKPRLILLDEPTSGMGIDDIAAMKALIADLGRDHTVLFIEHNMGIVMDISDRITVMQSGRVLVEGTPAEIRDNPEVRRAYLGSMMTGGKA